jgi:hypothetical protein
MSYHLKPTNAQTIKLSTGNSEEQKYHKLHLSVLSPPLIQKNYVERHFYH